MSSLRVIAGKAGGLRLRSVPGDATRPITDRSKESLFNILSTDIIESTFLDLFAGTGSVGIEALSRGANFARFVDKQRLAVDTIRANIKTTRFSDCSEVLHMDAFTHLERESDKEFDYIFIAPPQYKEIWKKAIMKLDDRPDWLSDGAWVIVQIHPVEYEKLELKNLEEFDQRKYGSTIFIFYEKIDS